MFTVPYIVEVFVLRLCDTNTVDYATSSNGVRLIVCNAYLEARIRSDCVDVLGFIRRELYRNRNEMRES